MCLAHNAFPIFQTVIMGVYDLSDVDYLRFDMENVLARIELLYDIEFKANGNSYLPKTIVDSKHSWASKAVNLDKSQLEKKHENLKESVY